MKKILLIFLSFFLFSHCFASSVFEFNEEDFMVNMLWNKVKKLQTGQRPKTALVLGGGGARGFSHIGVFRVFEEEKIPVDLVVGTSVGSIIGAFYCAGISMDKVEELAKDISWKSVSNFSATSIISMLLSEELLSNAQIENFLKENIGDLRFEQLKIPLVCVSTDLHTGERVLLKNGSVAFAARASSTLPGFFKPVEYKQRYLVDGGLVDNVPVGVAKLFDPDVIIAVPVSADITKNTTTNVFTTLMQAIYIQGRTLDRENLSLSDAIIRPDVGEMLATDLGHAYQSIDKGFAAARESLKDIKMTIINKTQEVYLIE
ncbi:MAG: patatin-like phospholipase family protein [Endomicrobium sp.]|jgi:NTE family protein|nr:patatin-like phospholipase family protein [Endomicrobium sp.]